MEVVIAVVLIVGMALVAYRLTKASKEKSVTKPRPVQDTTHNAEDQ